MIPKAIAATAVALAVAPAAPAAAAPGWELPQITSFVHGNKRIPNTTYARHCGRSQFGVYRFAIGVTERGRQGSYHFLVRISPSGKGHRPNHVRRRGHVSRHLRRETESLLRRVNFRYVPTPTPSILSVFRSSGKVQTTIPFAPAPRSC